VTGCALCGSDMHNIRGWDTCADPACPNGTAPGPSGVEQDQRDPLGPAREWYETIDAESVL